MSETAVEDVLGNEGWRTAASARQLALSYGIRKRRGSMSAAIGGIEMEARRGGHVYVCTFPTENVSEEIVDEAIASLKGLGYSVEKQATHQLRISW